MRPRGLKEAGRGLKASNSANERTRPRALNKSRPRAKREAQNREEKSTKPWPKEGLC